MLSIHHLSSPQSNSLYSSEELTTLQANNNPNTLNTRNFHPAVLLQNLPRTRRKSPQSYGNKHHLLYLSLILILQSADCEQNPGPRTLKYPCMICSKAVKWNQRAVACDNCKGWYHAECMNMNSKIYTALTKPDTSWICCSCGIPNFSTSLFESFNINESSNRFDSYGQHILIYLWWDRGCYWHFFTKEQDTTSQSEQCIWQYLKGTYHKLSEFTSQKGSFLESCWLQQTWCQTRLRNLAKIDHRCLNFC